MIELMSSTLPPLLMKFVILASSSLFNEEVLIAIWL